MLITLEVLEERALRCDSGSRQATAYARTCVGPIPGTGQRVWHQLPSSRGGGLVALLALEKVGSEGEGSWW